MKFIIGKEFEKKFFLVSWNPFITRIVIASNSSDLEKAIHKQFPKVNLTLCNVSEYNPSYLKFKTRYGDVQMPSKVVLNRLSSQILGEISNTSKVIALNANALDSLLENN